jgi:hypothetical protein
MRTSRLAMLIAVPAVIAAAVIGSGAVTGAPAPGSTLTVTELARGSTFTHIRNTPTTNEWANLRGDLIVFTNPLADASGKVVGRLHVSCATTVGARNFRKSIATCDGVLALRGGTLTVQANIDFGSSVTHGAVTGGTGAYANARGTLISKSVGRNNVTTITFAP